jgi:hypothetical protein
MFVYYFIDMLRALSLLTFIAGPKIVGIFYKLFQVNEFLGVGTIVTLYILRLGFEIKLCSGDYP